jgi:hypothetical protein
MLPPGILTTVPVLDETVFADNDDVVSVWEADDGGTTDIFEHVDSESDADHVELRSANHIVTSGSRSLRFFMQNPSAAPSPTQTVDLRARCEWIDVFGSANPDAGDPNIVISLFENTTLRAASSAVAITETPVDYSLILSEAQINSVTDWDDVRMQMVFEASGIDIDEEVNIQVYRVRIIFSA